MSARQLARYRLECMLGLTKELVDTYPLVDEEPLVGPTVTMNTDTGLVTVEVEIFIARPVEDVAHAIDPQNWDVGGRFFHPDGTFLVSPDYLAAFAAGDYRSLQALTTLAPGTDYDWAVLYEHFCARDDDGGVHSEFHNLLWVNPDWICMPGGERRYVVSYRLHTAVSGRVGGVLGVAIERDDGELSAKPLGPTRSRVRMRKRIRFASEWANIATYAGFRMAQRELDDQFVETASTGMTSTGARPKVSRRRSQAS